MQVNSVQITFLLICINESIHENFLNIIKMNIQNIDSFIRIVIKILNQNNI
jgi:hypothetical protein